MADDVDMTTDRIERETDLIVHDICRCASLVPKGEPGECFYCGESFARVIVVTDPLTDDSVTSCGRCRDQRGIK